jgi:hypothetical protein
LIYDQAEKNPAEKGMGTTMVAALISGIGSSIANIGDSRAYLIKRFDQAIDGRPDLRPFPRRNGQNHARAGLDPPRAPRFHERLGIYPSVSLTITRLSLTRGKACFSAPMASITKSRRKISSPSSPTDERADQKVMSLICVANSMAAATTKASPIGRASVMIEIGEKIDERYRVTSRIAHGGMADVYEAYDIVNRRSVALKVMRVDMMETRRISSVLTVNASPRPRSITPTSSRSMAKAWSMGGPTWRTNTSMAGPSATNSMS